MLLKGRTTLVTGAAGGIGRAVAGLLAAEGSNLVLWDAARFEWDGDGFPGIKARCRTIDITDREAVESAAGEDADQAGGIDVLVNNAGITRDNLIFRMSPEEWDAVIRVNLTGAFNCLRSVSRHMSRRRSGSIINMASVIGLRGNAGQANYGASKAGLIGLTKSAARELARFAVRVNAIAPGYIETPMTGKLDEKQKKAIGDLIPMKKLGTPEDVARAVLFLASDLSTYVTGTVLAVDGGFSM